MSSPYFKPKYTNTFKRRKKVENSEDYIIDARFISMVFKRIDRDEIYKGYTIDILDWTEKAFRVNLRLKNNKVLTVWVPNRYVYKKIEKRGIKK